jgi:hypothetical protein
LGTGRRSKEGVLGFWMEKEDNVFDDLENRIAINFMGFCELDLSLFNHWGVEI